MVFIQSMSIEHVLFSNGVGIFLNKNRHLPFKNIYDKNENFSFGDFKRVKITTTISIFFRANLLNQRHQTLHGIMICRSSITKPIFQLL